MSGEMRRKEGNGRWRVLAIRMFLVLALLLVAMPATSTNAQGPQPGAPGADEAKANAGKGKHKKELRTAPVEPPTIPTRPQQPINGGEIKRGPKNKSGIPADAPAAAGPAAADEAAGAVIEDLAADDPAATTADPAATDAGVDAAIGDASSADLAAVDAVAAALSEYTIDMKVLVVAADGNETDFPAITAFLRQIGIPFDTLLAAQQPLTAGMLSNGTHGFYQGIILTTGNLGYDAGGGNWQSAFDSVEWGILWDYEAQFGVRQLTSYTLPGGWPDTYGLTYAGYQDTTTSPLQVTLTAAAKQMNLYPYLNTASAITIKNAWTYLGKVVSPGVTTPLLVTSNGYAIASITTYPDGRQNLAVTAANNPYLIHSLLLSYGNINWVTKGAFLGERHVYLSPQNDDLLIDDDIWDTQAMTDTTGLTYRMTGADLTALVTWQNKIKLLPTTRNGIITEWAFVGEGASGIYARDTLTPAVIQNQKQFRWVNHTYTHLNLDAPVTAAETLAELQRNHDVAVNQLRLTNYQQDAFVNPDISGLTNPEAQSGLAQFGIKFQISDTSRPGWDNPSPNAGIYNPDHPDLLIIPRRPTNLFYNLDTKARWVSEYNCFYGPTGTCAGGAFRYWPTNLTYQQIIDKESDMLLQYLLKWDIDPLMFHQPNTRNLGSTSNPTSLFGDLISATLTKYNKMVSLPIINLSQRDIGLRMARRMAYDSSGVSATLSKSAGTCSMTITAAQPAIIPFTTRGAVTGLPAGSTSETYGGDVISYVPLSAGQSAPLTLPASACQ